MPIMRIDIAKIVYPCFISTLIVEVSMSSGQKQFKSLRYSDSGVNIDEGNRLIRDIVPHANRTKRAGVSSTLGGFGGLRHESCWLYRSDTSGRYRWHWHKTELAKTTGLHHAVGIDLVAMCANDILVQGAMPLFSRLFCSRQIKSFDGC